MGLLNRLSSEKPATPVERPRVDRLDPFLGDRDLRTAYRALADGDWRRLEKFLDNSPNAWMFRSIATGETVGLELVTFERWAEFRGSPKSRVYLASARMRDAFTTRAAAMATNGGLLSDDEHLEFTGRLKEAEGLLREVVADRPAMAEPWIGLMISARGLGADLDEIRERYENAHSRAPFRPDGCKEYIESLTKKWGGSTIATFDFARWLEAEAQPSSPAREALPMAHIEKARYDNGLEEIADHLTKPEVVEELAEGLHNFLQAIPTQAPTESLGALNAYALALSVNDDLTARLVTETFARIDNRPTEYPWSIYAEDINHVFSEIQADQLRLASRF